jgi:hypothetical protein
MRFLLLVILVPLLLIPVAVIGFHVFACGIHVSSVDLMLDKKVIVDWQGRLYSYCKFMAEPLRTIA